jgi:Zn finger protein HypA/HybF involved in hydrogenase expression
MTATLRLFISEQDEAEDRRLAKIERVRAQPRCRACGRFSKEFWLEGICLSCMHDTRPAIMWKVDQARRWYALVRTLR